MTEAVGRCTDFAAAGRGCQGAARGAGARAKLARMAVPPGGVEPQVEELKRMLERELDREARPPRGCWPLAVALAGVLLGVLLLLQAI